MEQRLTVQLCVSISGTHTAMPNIPFSVLDLSPIVEGGSAAEALRNTLDLARHAERWDYQRYWLAEHHNMPGIASAATAVVVGHVAGGTRTIRVGSGGVMLPNHAPLVVAEQFGTLESLYPERIDLGIGRAPGTDQTTARALRCDFSGTEENFVRDVQELRAYLAPVQPVQVVRAIPGEGLRVPIWLLGSSLFSAQLAAALGMPFAFASHFAPDYLMQALDVYRRQFRPSEQLQRPYAMVGVSVVAEDTDAEAHRLATSLQQQWVNLRRGTPGRLQPPVDSMEGRWTLMEKAGVEHAMAYAAVGSPATVSARLTALAEATRADEMILTAQVFDHRARLRTFEIVAEVRDTMTAA